MTEKNKLIELIVTAENNLYRDVPYINSMTRINAVADYLLANGVKVPPVDVGTTVYEIRSAGKSLSNRKYDSSVTTQKILKYAIARGDTLYVQSKPYAKSDSVRLGKTVFLTREEAEKALKEREENA